MVKGLGVWPDSKDFALCLTHDVDRVRKSWWHSAFHFLKTGKLHHLKTLLLRDGRQYWNIEKIVEMEEKLGVKSTFFFLNEKKPFQISKPSTFELAFGNYDIFDEEISEVIRHLDRDGWEIGVHGSYDSYDNLTLLSSERKQLESIIGKTIIGVRQHYLNLDIPRTWELQRKAGFKYDTSLGFNDKIGFRENKIYPFFPFDDEFLELPLVIMDVALFSHNNEIENAWHKCEELIGCTQRARGLLTINWHSNRFNNKEYPGQEQIFVKVIEECKRRKAWTCTAGDVWRWLQNVQ